MDLQPRIEAAITQSTGSPAQFASTQAMAGGSINDSRAVTLEDGRRFFLKTNRASGNLPGLFETEFLALEKLAAPGAVRVPHPVACDSDFIVMEIFERGTPARDWQQQMGRQLAELHRATRHDRFGFDRLNYLGTTAQPNDWQENWVEFYRDQRLGWQLKLFAEKAGADDPLLQAGQRLLERLDDIIGHVDEPPVLLHGDLWSGNAAADADGAPVIFDPASYYGQREAEIGMMRMFGGFGRHCEAAYHEVWPLPPDSERRIALYRLYHELNHLNLFGGSYYSSCLGSVRGLL